MQTERAACECNNDDSLLEVIFLWATTRKIDCRHGASAAIRGSNLNAAHVKLFITFVWKKKDKIPSLIRFLITENSFAFEEMTK